MSAERLSVESLENAALDNLFQQGLRLRLYVAPFFFLTAMLLLAWEPGTWRTLLTVRTMHKVRTEEGVEGFVLQQELAPADPKAPASDSWRPHPGGR